jgi:NitT/TauT family transport system substrate-binding protein
MKTILNSLALLLITVAVSVASDKAVIRVGHFPNITHVQGLVAHNLSRQGKGWFEARLGPGVEIQWFTYNAGPSAMEAIFAKSIELTYVGPGPALNAYAKSQGEEIRIIAGAANGGAALVVHRLSRADSFSLPEALAVRDEVLVVADVGVQLR